MYRGGTLGTQLITIVILTHLTRECTCHAHISLKDPRCQHVQLFHCCDTLLQNTSTRCKREHDTSSCDPHLALGNISHVLILYAQHPNCLAQSEEMPWKCAANIWNWRSVRHSQEFTTRSGSSSKTTAVTASCSAMTIHSHSNGRFYPCDLIRLCRRIVRRRRHVKQQCKHEGSWSPTTFL